MASKLLKARKSATRTKARTRTRTKAHARRQEPVRRTKRWSQKVTQESNALDLERGVFTRGSSHAIALSLKRSALKSRRRKANAYRSALSMLTFYVNRAGRGCQPRAGAHWIGPNASCGPFSGRERMRPRGKKVPFL